MKKILLVMLAALMSLSVQAFESVKIAFVCQGIHDKPMGNIRPKSPMQPPTVYIEDYMLTFQADHPEYVLNIKDEDGNAVYTTLVSSAETQVTLPSTLSGDYEIELVMGDWLFTGWIYL